VSQLSPITLKHDETSLNLMFTPTMTTNLCQRHPTNQPPVKRRGGQTLIEFALVVPILLALMIGILEFGWLTKNTMTLASAAREGARAAAVGKTTSEIVTRTTRFAEPISLSSPNGTLTLQQCDSTGSSCVTWPSDNTSVTPNRNGVTPPNMVRLRLVSRHRSLTGFIPGLNGREIVTVVTIRREA
jgi:Flp pilus assembly protein TadG